MKGPEGEATLLGKLPMKHGPDGRDVEAEFYRFVPESGVVFYGFKIPTGVDFKFVPMDVPGEGTPTSFELAHWYLFHPRKASDETRRAVVEAFGGTFA